MAQYTILLDANILYPAPMRDLFLQLAAVDMFRARWSADIQREWVDNLLAKEPHRERAALERTCELMNRHARDVVVTGYETLIPSLSLPDRGDRHVLAAAIVGRCDMIVTQNLKDFPTDMLAPFGIDVQHPDVFLHAQISLAPGVFCAAVRDIRNRLRNPPYTVEEYLDTLVRQGLVATAAELQQYARLL